MATFSKPRVAYHCDNKTGSVEMSGEMQFDENKNLIVTLTGNVSEGANHGSFIYLEDEEGNISFNISAGRNFYDSVKSIADATIEDIHTELDK